MKKLFAFLLACVCTLALLTTTYIRLKSPPLQCMKTIFGTKKRIPKSGRR